MNTHKEPKYKERQWVVSRTYRYGDIGYIKTIERSESCPYEVQFDDGVSSWFEETSLELIENASLAPLEPTPPSQIEEESQTQRSLREMYELGKEHGRTLALKDMEIEKLIKETEELL